VNTKEEKDFNFLHSHFASENNQVMIALGGGKDSLVSCELVRKA
jgi:tRNA(Ile)-lysidine synthase TilS/MesJ